MLRVAYLNTRYPSLSHTFIEREIRAVRRHGVEVHTFSIRRPTATDCAGSAHEAAARETCYILQPKRLLLCLLWAMFTRPLSLLRVVIASQRASGPGVAAHLKQLIYAAEAVRLAREMRSRGLSHVHVHMANNGAAVAYLASVFDRSLTYSLTIHGSEEFVNVTTYRLKLKAEAAAFVRCISEFGRAQVMLWTDPAAWARCHVVHCGLDPTVFTPRAVPGDGSLRLLTVGRLDPFKGYDLLLQACAALSKRGVDWRLDMVGDGPLRPALEATANEWGIADRVMFHGAVSQDRIQSHYDSAHALVLSSFMEGLPVVLMEAMAKEVAVVATRVAGIPELVEDGVNGLLVTPGSVSSLAGVLERLARDRSLIGTLGKRGRERIVAEFAIDDIGRAMAELLNRYGVRRVEPSPAPAQAPVPVCQN